MQQNYGSLPFVLTKANVSLLCKMYVMEFAKIHNKGQARLFQNPLLEFLTKGHPLVIWGIYTPAIVYMLYYSVANIGYSWLTVLLVFIVAMLFWTLVEYVLHRWVFHWHPTTPGWRRFVYVMHGNHHEYPRDKHRLFMPPLPSVLLASAFFGLYYLVMGNYAFAFWPGFMLGYLMYGTMHYAIHAWAPPKWAKGLWRNHHLHHYKHGDKGFGVSNTIWDHVFGTLYDTKKETMTKEEVQELMY